MCFILYAGTERPIPRREWAKETSESSVTNLDDAEEPIRAHFSCPEIQCVGSTSGCGCDFPWDLFQGGGWPSLEISERAEDEIESDQINREMLVRLLRATEEKQVELYGVYWGDFEQRLEAKEEITLDTILNPEF